MEPSKFTPETLALAAKLAATRKAIVDKQAAGDQILEAIVEQLQKFRDLPSEIAALNGRQDALSQQLSVKVAAELASLVG